MANLSISKAWDEAAAFVSAEGALLFPVAFALTALPTVVLQYFAPVANSGQPPMAGPWVLLLLPVLVCTIIGGLAINILALRPGQTVGEAIGAGARRFVPVLGAVLLLGIAGGILAMPGFYLMGVAVARNAPSGLALFIALITFILMGVAGVRLLMLNAVGAVEPLGPIAMIKRSWALTAGHFWKLAGFLIVFAIVTIIVSVVGSIIGGLLSRLVAGPVEDGGIAKLLPLLISSLVSAAVSVYGSVAIARMYIQLAGSRA